MILTVEELSTLSTELNVDVEKLEMQSNAIEDFIRHYTNNSFTIKPIRFITSSLNGKLKCVSSAFNVGDTIQISKSEANNGVYVIKFLDGTLDRPIFDADYNTVTLVVYPPCVKLGVMDLLRYNAKMSDKMGISSETLSRHSVTYAHNNTDSIGGYPAYMMSFLKPYMKARF